MGGAMSKTDQSLGSRSRSACPIGVKENVNGGDWWGEGVMLGSFRAWSVFGVCSMLDERFCGFSVTGISSSKSFCWRFRLIHILCKNENLEKRIRKVLSCVSVLQNRFQTCLWLDLKRDTQRRLLLRFIGREESCTSWKDHNLWTFEQSGRVSPLSLHPGTAGIAK